jgi:hypothetical protein
MSAIAQAIESLFQKEIGWFRVVVLVVTDKPFNTRQESPTEQTARDWLRQGLNQLPLEAQTNLVSSSFHVSILVYEFSKAAVDGHVQFVTDSSHSAWWHVGEPR